MLDEQDQGEIERDPTLAMLVETLAETQDESFDEPLREEVGEAPSAAAASVAVPLSASQIATAFNAWKGAQGLTYNNVDGEAIDLRAFAANEELVREYFPEQGKGGDT